MFWILSIYEKIYFLCNRNFLRSDNFRPSRIQHFFCEHNCNASLLYAKNRNKSRKNKFFVRAGILCSCLGNLRICKTGKLFANLHPSRKNYARRRFFKVKIAVAEFFQFCAWLRQHRNLYAKNLFTERFHF